MGRGRIETAEVSGVALRAEAIVSSGVHRISAPLAGAKCLIVEDEPTVAAAQRRILEVLGAAVTVSGSVLEAVRALGSETLHGVVVDLRLPDGDGEAVVRRARTVIPPVGVVVVSGALDAIRPAKLRALGALVIDKNGTSEFLGVATQAVVLEARKSGSPEASALRSLVRKTEIERALEAFATRHRLSPQQTRMLALLTARFGNKEICAELGIAEETLRVQWGRTLEKIRGNGDAKAREAVLAEFARFCAGEVY